MSTPLGRVGPFGVPVLRRAHVGFVRATQLPVVVLLAAAALTQALFSAGVAHHLQPLRDDLAHRGRLLDVFADSAVRGAGIRAVVALVLSIVATALWSLAAYGNLRRLGIRPARSLVWLAVCWCVPILQPALRRALTELELGSDPGTSIGWSEARDSRGSIVVSAWWTATSLAAAVLIAAGLLIGRYGATTLLAGFAVWAVGAAAALSAVGSVCAALYVHQVTRAQEARLAHLDERGLTEEAEPRHQRGRTS